MNVKVVLKLISVDVKASRVTRGARFRHFRESRAAACALYAAAWALGSSAGWLAGSFLAGITDPAPRQFAWRSVADLFTTLPTMALLYGLILTQMRQVQRMGVKASIQLLYWLPITWGEYTLASIIASLLGIPLMITAFICSCILTASLFLDLMPLASLTSLMLLASLLLASATNEAFKALQDRMAGAITRAAGRAAVWVRFIGSILLFTAFYIIYFYLYYRVKPQELIESIAGGQRMLWFIPYLWPGMTLSAFAAGLWLEAALFLSASAAFLLLLFLAAVKLNAKFSLYEAPSIKVSRGGYAPRTGLLGRLGLSPLEAAIVRKDLKAFTRRRELMFTFILPIAFIVMFLLSPMREGTAPPLWFLALTLVPGSMVAVILGGIVVGSEGGGMWLIRSSPIPARSFVKAKYSFTLLFSLPATSACMLAASLVTARSMKAAVVGFAEAVILLFPLAMISLTCGIKGADFSELPRPRMIRPLWMLVSVVASAAAGLVVIAPLIPYGLQRIFHPPLTLPDYYPYVALLASGIVATIITHVTSRVALISAEELLRRAEQ